MSLKLPIFPLGLVVFPGEKLNLHIFEPRYKQLLNDVLLEHVTFGIPAFIENELKPYGTEVELLGIERVYAKGEMDVRTIGKSIFRIAQVINPMPGKLYSGAYADYVEPINNADPFLGKEIVTMMKQLHLTLKIEKEELKDMDEHFTSWQLGHFVGFNVQQEYDFMTLPSERDRQFMILQHLQKILPYATETERLKDRIQANGHFKDILPPTI
ncbi:LON peptidase substrate-binding domain-containing protein [soil metagenome]